MMTCKTCRHPDVDIINVSILAKISFRTLAARFSISQTALKRHASKHIPELLSKASEAEEVLQADVLLAETATDRQKVRELFTLAASSKYEGEDEELAKKAIRGDRSFMVQASREARGYTELLLKASGAWKERMNLDISGSLKVEQEEADSIRFIKECYPKLLPELAAWGKLQLQKDKE